MLSNVKMHVTADLNLKINDFLDLLDPENVGKLLDDDYRTQILEPLINPPASPQPLGTLDASCD